MEKIDQKYQQNRSANRLNNGICQLLIIMLILITILYNLTKGDFIYNKENNYNIIINYLNDFMTSCKSLNKTNCNEILSSKIDSLINKVTIKEKEIKCEDNEKVEEEKDEVKAKEKIEYTEPKKMEIDKDKNKEEDEEKIKYIKSLSKSAKSKGLIFKFSLMKKDNLFQIDDYRKIANKSHTKINSNLNLENLHDMLKSISNKEKKEKTKKRNNSLDKRKGLIKELQKKIENYKYKSLKNSYTEEFSF